jgi:hypothetical protein
MAMDLQTLQSALARIAATRGDDRFDHPRHLALALAAEAGAALDRFRWLTDAEAAALDDEARAAVARAAIAAMLYALRLAARTGADPAAIVAAHVDDALHRGDAEPHHPADAGRATAVAEAANDRAAAAEAAAPAADGEAPHEATVRLGALTVAPDESEANDARARPPAHEESHAPHRAPLRPAKAAGPAPSVERASAPLPAPSRMVAAASAAFARAQAAAARVNRSFAPPAGPDSAAATVPEAEDDFEPTITLDAGPTPVPAKASPPQAAVGEPLARPPAEPAASDAEARPEPATADAAKAPDLHLPAGTGSIAPSDDVTSGASASRTHASQPPESRAHAAHRHEHKPRDAVRAEARGHAPHADDTGSHSGRRSAHARQAERSGATGNHAAHGSGTHHGKGHGRPPNERRHGDGPQGDAGHGERQAGDRRTGQAEEHGGRPHHEAHGEPREQAAGHHRASSPPLERYAKLDFEAVQALRKSMARMLEGMHRKDPLLRELAEELETLRRTLYSNAVKPAWIADTLLTIRRMLEESVGDGLGEVLDAERRIAAIDALLG